MRLENKVALITGGAQGFGRAIAVAMANEGAKIAICDINNETLAKAAKEIEKLGIQCLGVHCDVSSSEKLGKCSLK